MMPGLMQCLSARCQWWSPCPVVPRANYIFAEDIREAVMTDGLKIWAWKYEPEVMQGSEHLSLSAGLAAYYKQTTNQPESDQRMNNNNPGLGAVMITGTTSPPSLQPHTPILSSWGCQKPSLRFSNNSFCPAVHIMESLVIQPSDGREPTVCFILYWLYPHKSYFYVGFNHPGLEYCKKNVWVM